MKNTILLLIAIATIACSCSKTKQNIKRIYGDYTLISYTVNGVDSLALYKDSLGVNFKFYDDDYNERTLMVVYGFCNDGKYRSYAVTWGLTDKTTLKIYAGWSGPAIGTGPFGWFKRPTFEILELNDIFKLQTNYNSKEYVVVLE